MPSKQTRMMRHDRGSGPAGGDGDAAAAGVAGGWESDAPQRAFRLQPIGVQAQRRQRYPSPARYPQTSPSPPVPTQAEYGDAQLSQSHIHIPHPHPLRRPRPRLSLHPHPHHRPSLHHHQHQTTPHALTSLRSDSHAKPVLAIARGLRLHLRLHHSCASGAHLNCFPR